MASSVMPSTSAATATSSPRAAPFVTSVVDLLITTLVAMILVVLTYVVVGITSAPTPIPGLIIILMATAITVFLMATWVSMTVGLAFPAISVLIPVLITAVALIAAVLEDILFAVITLAFLIGVPLSVNHLGGLDHNSFQSSGGFTKVIGYRSRSSLSPPLLQKRV